jgi:hypothetical protein
MTTTSSEEVTLGASNLSVENESIPSDSKAARWDGVANKRGPGGVSINETFNYIYIISLTPSNSKSII